jgi:dipeptidyl aminopeptidase/acylaminoacyl peptidase
MRPKIFTFRNLVLFLVASGLIAGLVTWARMGFPLPGGGVESTQGKIAFVSDRDGTKDIYLIDSATGQKVQRLTSSPAQEDELAFSPDGQQLTFVSDQSGTTRQVGLMYAGVGQRSVSLTNTSATKERPRFVNGSLYHLDAGKLATIATDASHAEAIFPDVEDKRNAMAALFATGGIRAVSVKEDGSQLLAIINQEDKKLLVVYVPEEHTLALLGAADAIDASYLADGNIIACFSGHVRLGQQPIVLYNPEFAKQPDYRIPEITDMLLTQGKFQSPPAGQDTFLIRLNKEYKMESGMPLVLTPDAIRVSPDGKKIALWKETETEATVEGQTDPANPNAPLKKITQKIPPGLMVIVFEGETPQMLQLFDKSCRDVTWAPDSKQLAFVSGSDVYRIGLDQANQATNLTNGKGTNSSPSWSPAIK